MSRAGDLEWLRMALVESIELAEPEKRAPLANQMRLVIAELEELQEADPRTGPVSVVDEVRQRREARASGA